MNRKLIILDRDGVINHCSDDLVKKPEEWHPIPGSLEAITRLCHSGYRVVVITNQSGISCGLYTLDTLNEIHKKMIQELRAIGGEIHTILVCPHSEADNCDCRKPKPGLFYQLADRLRCDLNDVYAVGDSIRDMKASYQAHAQPVLVKTGKGSVSQKKLLLGDLKKDFSHVPVFKDLSEFVEWILK